MHQTPIHRGRPAGQMTRRRRDVLAYVVEREQRGLPIVLGEIMRRYNFADRSDARRVLKDVKKLFGQLIPTSANDI